MNIQSSFDFGYHRIGTSTSQRFALGGSDYTFTPRISVSGEYAQTNNCPPTLSAGASPQIQGCLITVTFAPTGKGPSRGTLSTGPGGPEVALEGAGYLGRSVHDPRGDAGCYRGREGYGPKPCLDSTMRSAEIVRATAGHEGGRLRHTIRVVGKFQSGWLGFNTDSDESCEWWLDLERGKRKVEFRKLRECGARPTTPRRGPAVARGLSSTATRSRSSSARVRSETPTATAGKPPRLLWAPRTGAWPRITRPGDFGGYIRHELG